MGFRPRLSFGVICLFVVFFTNFSQAKRWNTNKESIIVDAQITNEEEEQIQHDEPVEKAECLTADREPGECVTLIRCHPILFTDKGEVRNTGLALTYSQYVDICSSQNSLDGNVDSNQNNTEIGDRVVCCARNRIQYNLRSNLDEDLELYTTTQEPVLDDSPAPTTSLPDILEDEVVQTTQVPQVPEDDILVVDNFVAKAPPAPVVEFEVVEGVTTSRPVSVIIEDTEAVPEAEPESEPIPELEPAVSEIPVSKPLVPETAVPETPKSEAEVPEPSVSEAAVPEPPASEAPVPEPQASEAPIPETQASEAPVPEPQASEAPIPEPQASEAPVPEAEPLLPEAALPEVTIEVTNPPLVQESIPVTTLPPQNDLLGEVVEGPSPPEADLATAEQVLEQQPPSQACPSTATYRTWPVFDNYPWLATIQSRAKTGPTCSGSLITESHVMTAAHCLHRFNSRDVARMQIRIGFSKASENDTFNDYYVERKASKIIFHKRFHEQSKMDNNIALIKLDEPVEFDDHIAPIGIFNGLKGFDIGNCSAAEAGWIKFGNRKVTGISGGVIHFIEAPTSDFHLRESLSRVFNNGECGVQLNSQITEKMLCAKSKLFEEPSVSTDFFRWNDGGPLVVKVGNMIQQIGIKSWAYEGHQYPTVYTRVDSYLDWIRDNLRM